MTDRSRRRVTDVLRAASRFKALGMTCPDALLAAYGDEVDTQSARAAADSLPEELHEPTLCDLFAVTFAIVAELTGDPNGYISTAERLKKAQYSAGCATHGSERPICTMRMKDCVLLIERAARERTKLKGAAV